MVTRRAAMGFAAAGMAVGMLPGAAHAAVRRRGDGQPAAAARVRLPGPTGPHAIGTVTARLVDRSRHDPWVPSRRYRELMISVWYPAVPGGGHRARYMAPGAAARWDATAPHGIPRGAVDFAALETHAVRGAPADLRDGPLPVVVYAAGAGDPRTWGTVLVEEMASRGHLVVTVDHTYESPGVEFPDGTVRGNEPLLAALAEAARDGTVSDLLKKTLDIRVADSRFVLDSLGSLPHGLSRLVDQRRVGMLGQSAGGTAAAQTMYEDRRVRAGVDLDGTLEYNPEPNGTRPTPVARHGLDRPFLLMGRDGSDRGTEPSWRSFWSRSTGWKRNLTLRGSLHQTYTDLTALLPQAGVDGATLEKHMGRVDPARAVAAQRAYVGSFFDRWLKDTDDGLLDAPSGRWPEVGFAG
ncbi:hypothetical protein AB0I16_27725 [Streptomyces sp. NPDC050703]|uniref:hypothetical protein n=1 Tax=Streptomyces sp. NPDC050703 TaxID=3157218 RepID=UPI00342B1F79